MEFLYFIGGAILGSIFSSLLSKCNKTYGIIKVDHKLQACKLHVTSTDLLNRSTKKAVFDIDHNSDLSREEQGL